MKPTTKNTTIAFILVPAIAYPFYAGVFFLTDSLLGDRIILRQLHEARRHLWDTFWADYAHALPVFYLIAAVIFLLPSLFIRRTNIRVFWLPILLGLIAGGVIGVYLSGTVLSWIALAQALIGAVLGILFSAFAHKQR